MKVAQPSYDLLIGYVYLLAALVIGAIALGMLLIGQYMAGALFGLPALYLVYASALYQVQLHGATLLVSSIYRRPRRYDVSTFKVFEKSFDSLTPIRICFADGTSYRFKPVLQPNSWLDVDVIDRFTTYWTKEITSRAATNLP